MKKSLQAPENRPSTPTQFTSDRLRLWIESLDRNGVKYAEGISAIG
ncbi:MAG: hypothetical protein NT070_18855 [Cyanobacteria bacterium]|nr:hypothetical protein [Cyanobacteriota bacterium]